MTETKTVSEPAGDSQPTEGEATGKPRAPHSKTQFPYYDLADAVKVATAIHVRAGGVCDRDQLAALLSHKTARSGAFLSRVAGAKMFGLVEQAHGFKLRVTPRGRAIVAPVTPDKTAQAKLDAFFDVELFRKVYEQHKGITLPDDVGLQNLFGADYGIVKSRCAPTVRVMLDSAEYAGLFETAGKSQMVMPVNAVRGDQNPPRKAPRGDEPGHRGRDAGNRNENVGGQDVGDIDPAIIGLLRRLPAAGTPLSTKRREKLIDAFTSVVAFIYPDQDDHD